MNPSPFRLAEGHTRVDTARLAPSFWPPCSSLFFSFCVGIELGVVPLLVVLVMVAVVVEAGNRISLSLP